ncbi:MAG: Gfo/Idh/MocA family oxidoreductase, partial [Phyllobacteriaceae bacterium]|nr:Gfo/Idh/MocA family oxidoreductase [Phyllobacteriaceae bacterium]
MAENGQRPIRLGMVGGGTGAFIGYVHRIASRLDGDYQLVAGALSSRPDVAKESGRNLGLADDRIYTDYNEMAREEAAREDGIEAVAIVTPNHMHFGPAKAFLEAGIHVICDKPLTSTIEDAYALKKVQPKNGARFLLTHNYTGYPLIRQARELVESGALGKIRVVQVEYPQDWLAVAADEDNKQAS